MGIGREKESNESPGVLKNDYLPQLCSLAEFFVSAVGGERVVSVGQQPALSPLAIEVHERVVFCCPPQRLHQGGGPAWFDITATVPRRCGFDDGWFLDIKVCLSRRLGRGLLSGTRGSMGAASFEAEESIFPSLRSAFGGTSPLGAGAYRDPQLQLPIPLDASRVVFVPAVAIAGTSCEERIAFDIFTGQRYFGPSSDLECLDIGPAALAQYSYNRSRTCMEARVPAVLTWISILMSVPNSGRPNSCRQISD